MDIDKHYAFIKKDYLIFKRRRVEAKNNILNGLENICCDQFLFIDQDIMQSFVYGLIERGVMGKAHPNHSREEIIHLHSSEGLLLGGFSDSCLVTVVPSEWLILGGMVTTLGCCLSNFNEISFLMEDDFNIYNFEKDSSLEFRGNRDEDVLIECEVIARGGAFTSVLEKIKQRCFA